MSAISDLISRLTKSAVTIQQSVFATQLAKTETYLDDLEEIRILIGNSASFGHQSSSINIMRSLIALGVKAKYTIALWAPDEVTELSKKIAILLPQFSGLNTEFQVDGCTVEVIDLSTKTLDETSLGITGGWDAQRGLRVDELNVANYVQLQPYGWTKGDYLIVQRDDDDQHTFDLNNNMLRLQQRGFSLPDPTPSSAEWTAITKSQWKDKAKIARLLVNYADNGAAHLWPMYGIKTLGQSHNNMINALSGLVEAQAQGVAGARRPTVIPVLQDLDFNEWSELRNYVLAYKDGSATFDKWRDQEQLGARVKIIDDAGSVTKDSVTLALSKLKNNEFLFLNLGSAVNGRARGLPTAVFNYVMGHATLPPVFEGQNTVELMLNLGRPYMKLSKQDDIRFSYPSLPITAGGNCSEATAAHQAAYYGLQGTPPNVWHHGSNDKMYPPVRNLEFIRAYLTGRGKGNALTDYFAGLGDFYHAQTNDKLLLTLNYLVNSIVPIEWDLGLLAADGAQPLAAPAPSPRPRPTLRCRRCTTTCKRRSKRAPSTSCRPRYPSWSSTSSTAWPAASSTSTTPR